MAISLKRREDIHFAEVGDEFFVLLEDADVLACINAPAFAVLENLDGFTDIADLVKDFAKASGQRPEQTKDAIEAVCGTMKELGFLVDVERSGKAKKGPFNFDFPNAKSELPAIIRTWSPRELAGGLFVNSEDCDIHVIVPNETDGPIKTCPPHTCTIPAGLFTARTLIRTFREDWKQNFKAFRRSGLVHFRRRG
jgi:hypothetical protein